MVICGRSKPAFYDHCGLWRVRQLLPETNIISDVFYSEKRFEVYFVIFFFFNVLYNIIYINFEIAPRNGFSKSAYLREEAVVRRNVSEGKKKPIL